jgi:hypothetical protein
VINVEAKVYSPIAAALRAAYSGISVSAEYVNAPSSFPDVTIVEQDNYMTLDKLSTSDDEEFATVMYEVNVYSNKSGGKKSECRAIMDTIDKMMYFRNFTRIAMSPVPNLNDATIYRMTARYRAETDGTNFYRR